MVLARILLLTTTEHQLHETLEITHGFGDWFELGFYVFISADSRVGCRPCLRLMMWSIWCGEYASSS